MSYATPTSSRAWLRILAVAAVIVLAAATRLVPHPLNVTPIGAIALFGGAHFANRRLAYLIPLAALLVGDFVIGFHVLMPFVYVCFAVMVGLGRLLRGRRSAGRVAGAALAGSFLFYLVTNFGVWLLLGTYPMTLEGLLACYIAGLPYLGRTLLGDLGFTVVLFGGFALAERRFPALRPQAAASFA